MIGYVLKDKTSGEYRAKEKSLGITPDIEKAKLYWVEARAKGAAKTENGFQEYFYNMGCGSSVLRVFEVVEVEYTIKELTNESV